MLSDIMALIRELFVTNDNGDYEFAGAAIGTEFAEVYAPWEFHQGNSKVIIDDGIWFVRCFIKIKSFRIPSGSFLFGL